MSKNIDERIVSMEFQNQNFERNAHTTLGTLAKLKQSLNFSGATKGLEEINTATNKLNNGGLSMLGNAVEGVKVKFSALEVMAVTTLANITNSAVNAGKRIVSALTIDPVRTGFQEYETQINAIQTILANTESKGSTLKDVNAALDELNQYADKTIYNFTEMTRNIGTFTAAGIDLETSTQAIKGISNLAAVSGSNAQQASTAMYQLSQALASGTVKLMDWNSVVNAGMGGQVFQDALKETARVHGIAIDDMIKAEGSFRETLQKGWLTSDILTETLAKFTGDLNEEQLRTMGYTEEQIKSIIKMGQTANDAATKVKTFTQLFDTLKEAAQSGWTQTWEILVGDFEEAKELLTNISDVVGGAINKSAEARNEVLKGWKDMGGRTDMIESFSNVFKSLSDIVKPISEAFRDIFPPMTAKNLFSITENIKKFTEQLKVSEETANKIKRTFKGVFSVFDLAGKAIKAVVSPFTKLFSSGGVGGALDFILSITAGIGDFITKLNESKGATEFFAGVAGGLSSIFSGIGSAIGIATDKIESFGDVLSAIGSFVSNVISKIMSGLGSVFGFIADNLSVGDIFAGLAGGGIFVAAKKFGSLLDKIKDKIGGLFEKGEEGIKFGEKFANVMDSVHESLASFSTGIKASTLLTIASAVGILSMSLNSISKLESEDVARSLVAIGSMMAMLNVSFAGIMFTLSKFKSKGLVKASVSLIAMATAINIFATALKKIAGLKMDQIVTGLTGLAGGLAALVIALKAIGNTKISLKTSVAILAIAEASKKLGTAIGKFSKLSWEEIGRGLTAMGGALLELSATVAIMGKAGGFKSILGSTSLLIAVESLDKIAKGLKSLGSLSWDQIQKGLTTMGGALAEFTIALSAMSAVGGFGALLGGSALLTAVQSLDEIAENMKKFGEMKWDQIQKGLTAMGGALAEFTVALGALSAIGGLGAILGGTAINIAVSALDEIGASLTTLSKLSWEEIGRGLTAMGGALLELSGIPALVGKLAPLGALVGSGSLTLACQGLEQLSTSFTVFAGMSWDEIGRGLTAMGGALTEATGIPAIIGSLAPLGQAVGSGSLLLATQGLGDLANAFKTFGEMDWDSIGRGLAAMGGAMGETALGGLLNTFSGWGADNIAQIAAPLGTLADSVKKWAGVVVPDGLGGQLGELGKGIFAFNFSGWGADAIAAVATPLGALATSVTNWTGIVVPEGIGEQLGNLASGVSKFNFSGWGADAIAAVATPLGTLATSISKWAGVVVPENMETNLASLASGIKAFNFAGWASDDMQEVVKPLGDLAGSIAKWKDVSISDDMGTKLSSLARGLKAFNLGLFEGGYDVADIVKPVGDLAGSIKKWNGVKIPSGLGSSLTSFANGIKAINSTNVNNIDIVVSKIEKLGTAVVEAAKVNYDALKEVGNKIPSELFNAMEKGVDKGVTGFKSTMSKSLTHMVNYIKTYYDEFKSAGKFLVEGFAAGITANTFKASAQAAAMASAALSAAKEALDINSPSKEAYALGDYTGKGFINSLIDNTAKVYKAGYGMADAARSGLSKAVSKIYEMIDTDMDMQPTITPVVDLSGVRTGVKDINGLLGDMAPVGLRANIRAINASISGNQNGANDDVVSAINKLRKDLGNIGGDTYNVNGVSVSDTDVVEAIHTLVRAVKVERRV